MDAPGIENQAEGAGYDLRNGEGKPGIGQVDAGEEPEHRDQAEDLPGQREKDAGQRRPDGLEEHREDQGEHRGQKAQADDVEGVGPDGKDLRL